MPDSACNPGESGQSLTPIPEGVGLQNPAGSGPEYPSSTTTTRTTTQTTSSTSTPAPFATPGPGVGTSQQLQTGYSRQVMPELPPPSQVHT